MAELEYAVVDGVATLTLNRPHRRNAFTLAMLDEWAARIGDARRDPRVRVLTVTGAGGAFCAGVDLDDFDGERGTPLADKLLLSERVHLVAEALEGFDKPYVALVDGVAVGAGMDMALMADIRLVSSSSRLAEGYIKVGLLPGDGGCWLLPRIVGKAKALELLWTGDFIDADEALRLGIANHVWPQDVFDQESGDFIRRLAQGPPMAQRFIKRAVVSGEHMSFMASLDLISSHQAIVQSTEDSKEALAAFREKRAGVFTGR